MTSFVQEYGVLRWGIVAAFVVAAGIVLARLATVLPVAGHAGAGLDGMGASVVPRSPRSDSGGGIGLCRSGFREVDRESDAAHLLMCLVMLAMLVFPAAADPGAVRAVLTAMTVVYVGLLLARIAQWRGGGASAGADDRAAVPGAQVTAFAYHVVAAAAMLYAMSGHTGHHSGGGPAPAPMFALAALFLFDAVVMTLPTSRRALRHVFPHPVGATGPVVVLPHVVMDLGTAFMLVAAAAG